MNYVEISDNLPGEGCSLDDWNTTYAGCICQDPCQASCQCVFKARQIYDHNGRLEVKQLDSPEPMPPINECHLECSCDEAACLNRVVQKGCTHDLEVFDCQPSVKGRGLRARERILAGSFVIEYMGEVIGPSQAAHLLQSRQAEANYILFLKEHYAQSVVTTVIDARNYSNAARFINHSCDPNLVVLPVRIDNVIPHAALFAKRDIEPNEELSYDYNGAVNDCGQDVSSSFSQRSCLCQSMNCRGFLPRGDL